MWRKNGSNPIQADEAVLTFLDRLWQTKAQSIELLETWQKETRDADIHTGLGPQLIDERRHLRQVSEEIKRLGGTIGRLRPESTIGRAFGVARDQKRDLARLCVYYRSLKAQTVRRCEQVARLLPPQVSRLIEETNRDENRHLRWAEIRITRRLTPPEQQECHRLMLKAGDLIESAWQKSQLELLRSGRYSA